MLWHEEYTREPCSPREIGREPSSPLIDPEEVEPTSTEPSATKLTLRLETDRAPSRDDSTHASTAPSSPTTTMGMGSPNWSTPPPTCKQVDCPIKEPHHEGIYRHNGEDSSYESSIFKFSNPPPHIWEAMYRIGEGDGSREECDWLLVFLRLHGQEKDIEVPSTPMTTISQIE